MKPMKYVYNEFNVGAHFTDLKEVQKYDKMMGKFRNISKEIEDIRNAIVKPSSTILEIGTGTGALAVGLAKYCKKVIAIDVSPVMLEFAENKAESRGIKNIEFHKGGFLTYDHKGKVVDGIVSQIALHHIPDCWKFIALKRLAKILKSKGKLYLRDVVFPSNINDDDSYFASVVKDFGQMAGKKLEGNMARHITREYSTVDWIMEGILKRAGFRINRKKRAGFLVCYVCTKK
jgi:putative AdoMet-dependent methyltransferase